MSKFTSIALALTTLFAGCASAPSPGTLKAVRAQANPVDRAQRTITNFTPALRCMDEWMFKAGTRDVTLMMEEMRDATQKVPISARDMMTSAISEMTRRSRAVRLSVFGSDQGNLMQLLQVAQKTQPFQVLPEYNIRGTVSQFDEDIQKRSTSLGLVAERLGLRLGSESRFSVLAFDAAMVRTDTLTLVPGVSSKNTTVVSKRDTSAGDGQGRLLGVGAVFAFEAARAEGNAQAARNMIELAAVELVGKLIRAPYWQCVGVSDTHPDVQREVDDWFESMDEGERIAFVKSRLRERRWFDGAADDNLTADFSDVLARTRVALGLPAGGDIDRPYFGRLIQRSLPSGPLSKLRRGSAPVGTATAAPLPQPVPSSAASGAPPARVFAQTLANGQADLRVIAAAPGHVFCFAQDPSSQVLLRIYPNRFVRDSRIDAGAQLSVPGSAKFTLDGRQRFACVHTATDIYNELPPQLRWGDFDEVRLKTFDEIAGAFSQAAGQPVALLPAQVVAR